MMRLFMTGVLALAACDVSANDRLPIWPDLAPGETTRQLGRALPPRPEEQPTVTRVVEITSPTMTVHLAEKGNGTGVVILPGGGFGKVVPDKEGTEAADWLNQHGVSAFVLSYRTQGKADKNGWHKPLQDAQRALSVVRSQADRWQLNPKRIGLLGFSAGGQVAARLLSDSSARAYAAVDSADKVSYRPDFAVLIYPWNIYDAQHERLIEGVTVPADCPPTFLAHTGDDRSSSLGAVLFYAGLKRREIPAELHIYGNGGHGYGLRPVPGSQISTWPNHASHWLKSRGFIGD